MAFFAQASSRIQIGFTETSVSTSYRKLDVERLYVSNDIL